MARIAVTMTGLACALALAACGKAEEKQAAADAKAAGFVPPSVTSRLDWGAAGERRFHALDRNGDDVLTSNEVPRPDSRILRYDRDGDGDVSLVEFSEGTMARFDRMDLNRDGTVTSEERQTSGEGRREPPPPADAPGNAADNAGAPAG